MDTDSDDQYVYVGLSRADAGCVAGVGVDEARGLRRLSELEMPLLYGWP